jgi:hypothetical protein
VPQFLPLSHRPDLARVLNIRSAGRCFGL